MNPSNSKYTCGITVGIFLDNTKNVSVENKCPY